MYIRFDIVQSNILQGDKLFDNGTGILSIIVEYFAVEKFLESL